MEDNRLRFVHNDKIWDSKESIVTAVNGKLQYDDNFTAVYGEPMVFRYGDSKNPNVVLAIGSLDSSETDKGKYFFIDFASVEESIDEIKEYTKNKADEIEKISGIVEEFITQYAKDYESLVSVDEELSNAISELKTAALFSIKNSDSIELRKVENEDGSFTLSADLRVPEEKKIDGKYVSNQLAVDESGVFYNIDLTCDKENNNLVLAINGEESPAIALPEGKHIVDGHYVSDSEELVLNYNDGTEPLKIDMRELIEEWNVEDEHDQQNGIILTIEDKTYTTKGRRGQKNWQDILKARIQFGQVAGRTNLATLENGGLFVSNDTKDLVYEGKPLNEFLDTLAPQKTMSQIISGFGYNEKTENFWIRFSVGDNDSEMFEFPASSLFKEFEVENEGHTVNLRFDRNVDGPSRFSADVKIGKEENNLLYKNEYNELVVEGVASKIKYGKTTVKDVLNALEDVVVSLKVAVKEAKANAEKASIVVDNVVASVGLKKNGKPDVYTTDEGVSYVSGKSVREDIKILDIKLTEIKEDVDSLGEADIAAIEKLKGDVTSLTEKVDANKEDIEGKLSDAVSQLEKAIEEHIPDLSGVEAEIKVVDDKVTDVKNDVDTVKDSVTNAKNDLTKLEASLSKHEGEYSALVGIVDGKLNKSDFDTYKAENPKITVLEKTDGHVHVNVANNTVVVSENDIASDADLQAFKIATENSINAIPVYSFESGDTVRLFVATNNKVSAEARVSDVDGNLLEIKGGGLLVNAPDFNYDPSRHTITYNKKEYQLNVASLVNGISYDASSNKLVISFTPTNSTEIKTCEVDVTQMFKPLELSNQSLGVTLHITTNSSGNQVISAKADVSNSEKNMLELRNGELYVDNTELENLKLSVSDLNNQVNNLNIGNLELQIKEASSKAENAVSTANTAKANVDALSISVAKLEEDVTKFTNDVTTNTSDIKKVIDRVAKNECDITTIQSQIKSLETSGVDLSSYYRKSEIDTILKDGYYTKEAIHDSYFTNLECIEKFQEKGNYALSSDLTNLATNESVQAVSSKVDAVDARVIAIENSTVTNDEIAELKEENKTLKATVETLQTTVNDLVEAMKSMVTVEKLGNGFKTNKDSMIEIGIAEGNINNLLRVTENGIDFVDKPSIDCGFVM